MRLHPARRAAWRQLSLIVGATLSLLVAACSGSDDNNVRAPDVASTSGGKVQAIDRSSMMRSYFAIPYAAPPVGALRWQPPQAPANWSTTLANTQSASPCLQTSTSVFRLANDREDCLYLDVHVPKDKDGPFPVMVWIHGGAFNTGGAVTYADPTPLVGKGVAVVTINYRLGAMGFLGAPALEAADGSVGNYGIMDQQAALKWVRDNVSAFGGDNHNVTIFGESAGGFSVLTHLASPLSKGLFDKAIFESGAYGVNGQLTRSELEGRSSTVVANAINAAGAAGINLPCTAANVTADCLRNLPESVLRNQLATAFNASMSSPTPSIDGRVLPQSIKAIFIAGQNNSAPVISGTNEDEYTLFIALGEYARRQAAQPPNLNPADTSFLLPASSYAATAGALGAAAGVSASALVNTYYPLSNYGSNPALQPSLAASALGTDVIFSCNGLNVAKRVQQQGQLSYFYEFRDQTAPPVVNVGFPQGAGHSYEIQYLFNLRDLGNPERNALQQTMSSYWTNFARNGNPNATGLVQWPELGSGNFLALDVTSGGGVTTMPVAAFSAQHKCQTAWSALTF